MTSYALYASNACGMDGSVMVGACSCLTQDQARLSPRHSALSAVSDMPQVGNSHDETHPLTMREPLQDSFALAMHIFLTLLVLATTVVQWLLQATVHLVPGARGVLGSLWRRRSRLHHHLSHALRALLRLVGLPRKEVSGVGVLLRTEIVHNAADLKFFCSDPPEITLLAYFLRNLVLTQRPVRRSHDTVAYSMSRTIMHEHEGQPLLFTTAHRINPDKLVLMQATPQRHIDQAISSTINLPRDTPRGTVERMYRQAWHTGCKGITVYREGAREGILLTAAEAPKPQVTADVPIAPRPPMLPGMTFRQSTPLGTAFITVNHTDQGSHEPFEVFVRLGKAGSDLEADAEALGRLISLILRLSSPMCRVERVQEIIGQLEMIGGAHSIHFGPARVRSLADDISRLLARYVERAAPDQAVAALAADAPDTHGFLLAPSSGADFCPRCRRAAFVSSMGCMQCAACGFREC